MSDREVPLLRGAASASRAVLTVALASIPPRGRCHWSLWTGEGQGPTACPSWGPQVARQLAQTWSLCGDSPSSCSSVLTLTHGTRVRRTRVSGPHVGSLAPGPGPVSTSQRAMSRSPAPQSGNEAQP